MPTEMALSVGSMTEGPLIFTENVGNTTKRGGKTAICIHITNDEIKIKLIKRELALC